MEENNNTNVVNNNEVLNTQPVTNEVPVTPVVPVEPVVPIAPVQEVTPVVDANVVQPVAAMPVTPVPVQETPVAPVNSESVVVPVTPVQEVSPVVDSNVVSVTPLVTDANVPVQEAVPVQPETPEKKKAPVNFVAIAIIVICCIVGGIFLWKNSSDSPKDQNPGGENPGGNVSTPVVDNKSEIDHPQATADKYVLTGENFTKTIYLKSDTNTFYYVTSDVCLNGNYGTYTIEGDLLTLNSELYFDCDVCYHTSQSFTKGARAVEVFTFNIDTVNQTISADTGDVYTSVGSEIVGNPFYNSSMQYCDNLGNAN